MTRDPQSPASPEHEIDVFGLEAMASGCTLGAMAYTFVCCLALFLANAGLSPHLARQIGWDDPFLAGLGLIGIAVTGLGGLIRAVCYLRRKVLAHGRLRSSTTERS